MPFKKIVTSSGQPIVVGNHDNKKDLFPPGFSYRIGGLIYTVKGDVTQDVGSSMREVRLSDGATEIMTIESIKNDLKENGCEILPVDERFTIKEAVVEKPKTKTKKKKKKKTKKK